jgi:hypothetical protein
MSDERRAAARHACACPCQRAAWRCHAPLAPLCSLTRGRDSQAEKVHHAQERELGLLFDESLSLRAEMDFDATTMALDNQRMKDELAAYAVVREQNEKFKELLAKMQESAMQTQEKHRKEVEDLRESVGVIKDKLTKEFRARIHKLSGEVSEAMAGAGEHAPQQNQAHHASKLAETESHIKVIMDKYTQLETEHDKVKLAHGLVQQSMEFQTKEMLHRKRELLESRYYPRVLAVHAFWFLPRAESKRGMLFSQGAVCITDARPSRRQGHDRQAKTGNPDRERPSRADL